MHPELPETVAYLIDNENTDAFVFAAIEGDEMHQLRGSEGGSEGYEYETAILAVICAGIEDDYDKDSETVLRDLVAKRNTLNEQDVPHEIDPR